MPSGSPARAIGIVSRAPASGSVKSRLARDLGAEVTAGLYAAFLRDALVCAASVPGADVRVFHPPSDDPAAILELCPPGVVVQQEEGHGFSEILPNAIRSMLRLAPSAMLLGADSPGVPQRFVLDAFEAVEHEACQVAVGPAHDGGFYLLATGGDYPRLFHGIDWGTGAVFEQVAARAASIGLTLTVLPDWDDVDTSEDLESLAETLATDGALSAGATRAALRSLRDDGVIKPASTLPWKTHSREVSYSSPWRSFVTDDVETHTGERIGYTYLETPQAVWVVPVTPNGRVILIRQYRHPVREWCVEVPAGGGEGDLLDLARRELREEIGGVAGRLLPISSYFPASAHLTHQAHAFVALDVELGDADLESTELISTFAVPLDLAVDMARRGEVDDSQSALAILAAEPLIRRHLAQRVDWHDPDRAG